MSTPLLDIRNLSIHFHTENGVVEAVKNISLQLAKGETLAVVGESGSGKSVTGLALIGCFLSRLRAMSPARFCWKGAMF